MILLQQIINGLTAGTLFALVAIGYTMVYGIIELINFAHGDLFMLGAFLALSLVGDMSLAAAGTPMPFRVLLAVSAPFFLLGLLSPPAALRRRVAGPAWVASLISGPLAALAFLFAVLMGRWIVAAPAGAPAGDGRVALGLIYIFLVCMTFCAALNAAVDRVVYKPLRGAPKLTPLVSAIGVSFVFMGLGQVWKGVADIDFPDLLPDRNFGGESLQFTFKDLFVFLVTVPLMAALTVFVKFTKLGKAMRAVAQNPVAAQLMGINVDRVISVTFLIGGALAGAAAVIYGLWVKTVSFQMGYQNGLYAFTAAVLGGIGNLPGAMLGGLVIGLVRSLGSMYVGEQWTSALVFGILILILVFRPTGLLGARTREKV
ncbi:MAG TPA: branched-chain amino acid ABC transporter permease [Planctomycetota bacterium]